MNCGLEIHSASDEGEKGQGTPNSCMQYYQMPSSQSKLGWIGLCVAQNAMCRWPRAHDKCRQLYDSFRLIRHAKT